MHQSFKTEKAMLLQLDYEHLFYLCHVLSLIVVQYGTNAFIVLFHSVNIDVDFQLLWPGGRPGWSVCVLRPAVS